MEREQVHIGDTVYEYYVYQSPIDSHQNHFIEEHVVKFIGEDTFLPVDYKKIDYEVSYEHVYATKEEIYPIIANELLCDENELYIDDLGNGKWAVNLPEEEEETEDPVDDTFDWQ